MEAPQDVRPRSLQAAAALTVVAVVVLGVLGGADALHVAALGALAALLAVVRVRLGGRHRGLLALASAGLATQPAFHFAGEMWPGSGAHVDPGHGWLITSVPGAAHIAFTVVTVASIAALEWVLDVLTDVWARVVGLIVRWLGRVAPDVALRACTVPLGPVAATRDTWVGYATRRGPPLASGLSA